MRIHIGNLPSTHSLPAPCAAVIGNFDGVHTGHLKLLHTLKQQADARQLPVCILIFEPQPQEFFARVHAQDAPYRLMPLREKLHQLRQSACVDAVQVLRFNRQLAELSAEDFIERILRQGLNVRHLLIGDDFRFGKNRQGSAETLQNRPEFSLYQSPSLLTDGIRTSSTAIRQALSQGQIAPAQTLLGHPYSLSGRVMHGAKLGRTLNCPTANIHLPPHRYPLSGIFVVQTDGTMGRHYGVASFGMNPTVSAHATQAKLEVHLFDFNGNLYGKRLQVAFLHKLRDETRFDSLQALQQQIHADIAQARDWLAQTNLNASHTPNYTPATS